jgi:uncharacterized damage-inducible protein DinB
MKNVVKDNLNQLSELLIKIDDDEYIYESEVFSGATVGKHMRHIVEFYLMLIEGNQQGIVSYDKRHRDVNIETDRTYAKDIIDKILEQIDDIMLYKDIVVEADFTVLGNNTGIIKSTMIRELMYCLEHSIHHQAIIKAGLISMGLHDITDTNFGVAYSTIRYRDK